MGNLENSNTESKFNLSIKEAAAITMFIITVGGGYWDLKTTVKSIVDDEIKQEARLIAVESDVSENRTEYQLIQKDLTYLVKAVNEIKNEVKDIKKSHD